MLENEAAFSGVYSGVYVNLIMGAVDLSINDALRQ